MNELIQDVIMVIFYSYVSLPERKKEMSSLFTILAQNLKPHSPNMFPTTGVARLNWSLEELPRSERCE